MRREEAFTLAAEIFELMARRGATPAEGNGSMCTALIVSMMQDGYNKGRALKTFSDAWDILDRGRKFDA